MRNKQQKEIVVHEPMIQVTMKDGRLLFFAFRKLESFKKTMKSEHFVEIEGVGVNKFEIKYYEPMPADFDVLIGLNDDQRTRAIDEFKSYKFRLGKEPNREVKMKKIARILHEDEEKLQRHYMYETDNIDF